MLEEIKDGFSAFFNWAFVGAVLGFMTMLFLFFVILGILLTLLGVV